MSKMVKIVGCGLLAGVLMVGPVATQAAEVTVGADVVSAFVFRGVTVNKDAVVQPSLSVSHPSGFAIDVWGNFDIGDDDGAYAERQFSEIDLELSYTLDLDVVSLTLGYCEYTYPAAPLVAEGENGFAKADREAYVAIGAELVPGLGLTLSVYQDLSTSDGTYAELGAEYGYEVLDGVTFAVNGSVAYGAKEVTGGGKAGWHDYLVGLSADIDITEDVSVTAFVNYVGSLDSDVLPSELIREDVFGGVGVYFSF